MKPSALRIGLIGPLPPPSGGMANQTRQLKELLEAEGISVQLVQVNAPYRPAWITGVRGLRALFRITPYLLALWRSAGQVDLFHVMANSGWSWHLFAAPAVWIAHMRGIPVVVNYRGGEAKAFLERSGRWVLPTLAQVDALAVPSGFLREVFGQFGVKAEIVPNVVDLSRFHLSDRANSSDAAHIVVTRNLEPIYDVATAIRAFALVRDRLPLATMTIAGSGAERAPLEELVGQLGLGQAVRFAGRLDREQMADLYRTANVMVNSSVVDNTPNSILEAMASGVPVVSTNAGGIPHLVENGRTALLAPTRDADALALAVLRVLLEPGLSATLRDAGLAQVKQYAWPAVKERLLSLYLRVVGQNVPEEKSGDA